MSGSLAGTRLLVVGASSGVGRAIGLAAAAAGASVAFAARRLELLETRGRRGGHIEPGDRLRRDRPVLGGRDGRRESSKALGGIDAVVYATGVDPLIRIEDVEADAWSHLFATNVIGASLVVRAALPYLRAVNGRAVFISATSVGRPLPGMGAYATSKAALEELARAWRSEHPEVSFSSVAIGMTLGTGVTDTWDGDLLGELSTVWNERGSCLRQRPRLTCSATRWPTPWSRCWRHRRAFRSSRCWPTRRS